METRPIFPGMIVDGGYVVTPEGHEGITKRRPLGLAFVLQVVDQIKPIVVMADHGIYTIYNRPNLKVIAP